MTELSFYPIGDLEQTFTPTPQKFYSQNLYCFDGNGNGFKSILLWNKKERKKLHYSADFVPMKRLIEQLVKWSLG